MSDSAFLFLVLVAFNVAVAGLLTAARRCRR